MDGVIGGEMGCELLEVAALEGEVEFAQQGAAELLHDRGRLVGTKLRGMLFRQFGQAGQDVQIGKYLLRNAGVLDFDDNFLAIVEAGAMSLGNGGRRQRFLVKVGKHFSRGLAELFLDCGHGCIG